MPAIVFGGGGLVHQPSQVVHRRAGIQAAGDQLGGEDGDTVVKLAAGEDVFRQRSPVAITAAVTVVGLGATVGSAFRAPRRAFVAELMQDLDQLLDERAGFVCACVGKVLMPDLFEPAVGPLIGLAGIGVNSIDD